MLIAVFSTMLYHYIKITTYESVVRQMLISADKISEKNPSNGDLSEFLVKLNLKNFTASVQDGQKLEKPEFTKEKVADKIFLVLHYPYGANRNLILKTDITIYYEIVKQILTDIIMVNTVMIFLVLFYAFFLSKMLLMPIKTINTKLAGIDEKFLRPVEKDECPPEYRSLLENINRLIERIKTFVLYQKELFIGIAHELKTPLAVMKSKNDVTLIKERDNARYIEALKVNNATIDSMNKMISQILQIGRQEGAQFEELKEIDIIEFLRESANNFKILARMDDKDIITDFQPDSLKILTQSNLLTHIMQNFVQNAIKFSPAGGDIVITSCLKNSHFKICIINDGESIDESIDYFAPFKRFGKKDGAGLGLFLAKGAAQAMGGSVSLKNRDDKKGVIATFEMDIKNKFFT